VDKILTIDDIMTQNMIGELLKHLIDTSELGDFNSVTKFFYENLLQRLIKIFENDSNENKIKNAK
jgi:hypothetical protein